MPPQAHFNLKKKKYASKTVYLKHNFNTFLFNTREKRESLEFDVVALKKILPSGFY